MMRYLLRFLSCALLASGSCTLAHADTVFHLSDTLVPTFPSTPSSETGSLTGTITVDTVLGVVTSLDLVATDSVHGTAAFTTVYNQAPSSGTYFVESRVGSGASADDLLFGIDTMTLVGYTGGAVCGAMDRCPPKHFVSEFAIGPVFDFTVQAGTLTAVSASTPEPSSLLLLSTAMLGPVSGAIWRRKRADG